MKYLLTVLVGIMLIPSVSVAAELTNAQSQAILGVLQAFGAESSVIEAVRAILVPKQAISAITVIQAKTDPMKEYCSKKGSFTMFCSKK
jgi:hypothetical protein